MDVVRDPRLFVGKSVDVAMFNEVDRVPPTEKQRAVERRALQDLFADTGGKEGHWLRTDNWCSSRPLSEWFGVRLDTRGFVCELKLARNGLCGPFPLSVGRLCELEVLELDYNDLHGEIGDSALNNLKQLEVLSLRHNRFTGEAPFRVFSFLKKLREVWLSSNQLTGTIHETVGECVSFTHLCLYNNAISGVIPASIGRLARLEVLSLGRNQLSGHLPETMKALGRLSHLSLYQNKFVGPVPALVE